MAAKPGPKKGSAPSRVRGEALPKLPGYTKLPGKSERYRTPDGGTISKRDYLAKQRQIKYFDGKRISNDKFTKINALVNRQVALSKSDKSLAEKRALAFKAAAIGVKAPSRRRGPGSMGRMFQILRDELEYDYDDDLFEFWWDDHES
jgi:hypothetical protein